MSFFSPFYLYLFTVLLFLSPLFYFITLELYRVLRFFLYFHIKYNFSYKTLLKLHDSEYMEMINWFIIKKEWFICICMLEFFALNKILNIDIIYNYLAYCYQKLCYFDLAEYYYLKVLHNYPDQLNTLYGLKELYSLSRNNAKFDQVNKKIKLID